MSVSGDTGLFELVDNERAVVFCRPLRDPEDVDSVAMEAVTGEGSSAELHSARGETGDGSDVRSVFEFVLDSAALDRVGETGDG